MKDGQLVISKALKSEIIQTLCEKLRENYVYPDAAEQICEHLQEKLRSSAFVGLDEGEFFAYFVTQYMQQVNHDEHLWVRFHPEPLPEGGEAIPVWISQGADHGGGNWLCGHPALLPGGLGG